MKKKSSACSIRLWKYKSHTPYLNLMLVQRNTKPCTAILTLLLHLVFLRQSLPKIISLSSSYHSCWSIRVESRGSVNFPPVCKPVDSSIPVTHHWSPLVSMTSHLATLFPNAQFLITIVPTTNVLIVVVTKLPNPDHHCSQGIIHQLPLFLNCQTLIIHCAYMINH